MKKPIIFVLIVLLLASLACNLANAVSSSTPTSEPAATLPVEQPTKAVSAAIFSDDFSDTNSGWPSLTDLSGSADYKDGGYEITVKDLNAGYWAAPDLADQTNVTIEVDATSTGAANDNDMGVVCRAKDGDNQYLFLYSADGYAVIGKLKDGTFTNLSGENWVSTSAINQGGALNHIRADCVDDTFALYINGEQVATARDGEFSSGMVGLTAGSYKQEGVSTLFDDFIVTKNNIPVDVQAQPANPTGSVAFLDDFSDPNSGWDSYTSDDGTVVSDYANGGYRLFVDKPNWFSWANPGQNFDGDVIVNVDVEKVGGPDDNEMGIICRYQDSDNFYMFRFSSDGYAQVAKYSNGDFVGISSDKMEQANGIEPGSAINHARAECVGDSLILYVNDNLVASATDTEFTAGDVGLSTGTFDTPGVDVLFSNFSVSLP